MQLQQGDILVKKSKGQPVYWLSERLVIEVCSISEEFFWVSRNRYKKSVSKAKQNNEFLPNTGKSWRYAKTKHGFYYCYDNIPDRKPTYYKSKFGTENDIKEALSQLKTTSKTELKEVIKQDIQGIVKRSIDNSIMRYYMFDSEVVFSQQKATELAEALAWCRFIKLHYNGGTFQHFGIAKKQDFLSICAEMLQSKALEGLKVSSSEYLRHKINRFPAINELDQRNYLISDKYSNENALKVGKTQLFDEDTGEVFKFDAHKAIMYNCYMNPNSPVKEAMRQLYVKYYLPAIEEFGYKPIAYKTFTFHLSRPNIQLLTARERHGGHYYNNHLLTYVPSEKVKYAHSLFAGDGSGTINYKYVNSKGELKTMKLYVITITDIATRKIVGYAFSPKGEHKETGKMVRKAVLMAMENCEYKTMFEFISDNHPAFSSNESNEFLKLVFNRVRRIRPKNSQANPAETEFRLLKQYLKSMINFISSSWKVGIEGQSNPDYQNIDSLPTYEDAIIQWYEIVEQYNATKLRHGVVPNEEFKSNKHPNCCSINDKIIRKIKGETTYVDVSYMRGFVQVSKTKGYDYRNSYLFEIPDYSDTGIEIISKACGYKKTMDVKVVYTPEMADLYTLDDKFIISCPAAAKSSQSYIEASEENKKALQHHKKRKEKALETADKFKEDVSSVYDMLPYTHEMAFKSNKEEYNGKMLQIESENTVLTKTEINKRDFDESEDWSQPL